MELGELTRSLKELFNIKEIDEIGAALMSNINSEQVLDCFCSLVEQDLSKDWLQMVYQYYQADRKEKKQDYTPSSIAALMAALIGESEKVIDLCAGSGALTIQRWLTNKDQYFELYEIDEKVIPFLLFNLVVRNIQADVFRKDVLVDEIYQAWVIRKGEKYGKCIDIQSAV